MDSKNQEEKLKQLCSFKEYQVFKVYQERIHRRWRGKLRRLAEAEVAFQRRATKQEFDLVKIPNPLWVLTSYQNSGALRGIELAIFSSKTNDFLNRKSSEKFHFTSRFDEKYLNKICIKHRKFYLSIR